MTAQPKEQVKREMAEISAAMVRDLREKTGAGMMDCKAALTATAGDVEAAIDWLRTKGLAKAAKKSGRIAAEGLIAVRGDGKRAAVVEVNSETDFVARNPQFQGLVRDIADVAVSSGADVEVLRAAPLGETTVAGALTAAVATIGEHLSLRRAAVASVKDGVVASYVHAAAAEGLGRIGVLLALEASTITGDDLLSIGRPIAMHVAAQAPLAVQSADLDAALVSRERAVLAEKNAGKPAHVLEKIIDSGLKSFYKEVCLLDQAFVMDPSKTVAQVLKEAGERLGSPIRVTGMVRFALGEGIEKETSDFAAEVAAAAGIR